jgi:translation elongation factor EF-G
MNKTNTNTIEKKLQKKVNEDLCDFTKEIMERITSKREAENIDKYPNYKIRRVNHPNDMISCIEDKDLEAVLRNMFIEAFADKMLQNRVDELLNKLEVL